MRNRNSYKLFILLAFVLFLGVGYAVVNSVSLTVTGTAGAGDSNLKVYFNGRKSISNTSKLSVDVLEGSTNATFTVSDLELNETVSFLVDVVNNEIDVPAKITITTSGSNAYYKVWSSADSLTIQPGETKQIGILVNMTKTPITPEDSIVNFTITLDAVPADLISFYIDGTEYYAETGMTWAEWIDSSYNQIGITVASGYVANRTVIYYGSSDLVKATSAIIADADYITSCCFDPGSKVLMADGTYKNIEDVEVGDVVMSLDESTGKYVAQKVTATIIKEKSTDLVYVHLSNGTRIGMRAYHPLLTTEGWKSLRPGMAETMLDVGKVPMLEVGDTLVGIDENSTIVSIEQRPEVEDYTTYNLSVENTHNYIVEGIVAHNAIPGC